jgi:hypothetical protein
MTARAIVIGSLCFVMGCSAGVGAGPGLAELQDELVATKPAVWTFFNIESCSDLCNDSACACITRPPACPTTSPAGQSCSTVGAHCLVKGSPVHHLSEYTCEQPPQYYRMSNANSGLCLNAASSTSGTAVVQSTCNSTSAQEWQVETPASSTTRIRHRSSGKCLDIAANLAVLNPCDSRTSERFQPGSSTSSVMVVRTDVSALTACLEIPSGSMALGVQAQQSACTNPAVPYQLWVFQPSP